MNYPRCLRWPCYVAVIVAIFFGCSDSVFDSSEYEIDKISASPELALPIAVGNLKIADLLTDSSVIRVYPDGLVYLVFDASKELNNIRTMIRLPDRTFLNDLTLPADSYGPKNDEVVIASLTTTQDFAFDPERLTEMKFKEGTTLQLDLSFSPQGVATDFFEMEVLLPGFLKDGEPLKARVHDSERVTLPLEGYVAVMDDNRFEMTLTLIETTHSETETVHVETAASLQASFLGIDFQHLKGFVGDRAAGEPVQESIEFSGLGNSLNGAEVSFAEPKITFSIVNEFGMPVTMLFDPAHVLASEKLIPIQFSENPTTLHGPPALGESALFTLDVENAAQIFNAIPDELFYGLSLHVNKGLTDEDNFMADTSKVHVNVHAELPLYGKANNIVVGDTVEIDLSNAEESNVESASIGAKVTNQLPIEAGLQLYFLDSKGKIFDSLFNELTTIIPASTVTENGDLLEPGVVDLSIQLDERKLEQLFVARKLIIQARGNTSKEASGAQHHVQFKKNFTMNIFLKLRAKVKLETEL